MELEDAVGADLGDGCDSPSLQVFAQLCDKGRRRSGCGSRIFGKVAAEAGIDEELFAVVGLVEFDEEDALFGSADNSRGVLCRAVPSIPSSSHRHS